MVKKSSKGKKRKKRATTRNSVPSRKGTGVPSSSFARKGVPSRKGTGVPSSSGKVKPLLTEDEREELQTEGELPKKSIRERENRQLIWFFVIAVVIFGSFLVPYFWMQSSNVFEYGGADWAIEDYDTLKIYHGRFMALSGADTMFNVFLRTDPRENNVETEGTFDQFKNGGIISISPEANQCRGELARVILDLSSFLKTGVGVQTIASGTTDRNVAREVNTRYAVCGTVNDRTLVILDIGEPKVVQDEKNPYCYTIYTDDCNDVSPVEKFIAKTISDLGEA